jgi:aspartate/methionine/tyrosine aminotransferase
MGEIEPFHVMALLARARQMEAGGRDIVHMEVGEPDFPTPGPILQAGEQALARGLTHYTPATGLPELREAIAAYYGQRYRVSIDPQRVIVTPGASGALQLALGVLVNPGDRVLLADPGYPCNRHFVSLYGGIPDAIPVGRDSDYQLTAALVEAHWTDNTVAVILSSPANPTGTLIPHTELAAIHRFVTSRGGQVIVDEIYHGLTYDQDPPTAAALSPEVLVVNSFSKYFGMTGWRLGWCIAPEAYVPYLDRLAQNLFLAPSTPAQYAALAAFSDETLAILDQRRETFRHRRDLLLPGLRDLGFDIPLTPQGAFYLYADCSQISDDSESLAEDLLQSVGVCVTPGKDFGSHQPERHLRFAYTVAEQRLDQGLERMRGYLQG